MSRRFFIKLFLVLIGTTTAKSQNHPPIITRWGNRKKIIEIPKKWDIKKWDIGAFAYRE